MRHFKLGILMTFWLSMACSHPLGESKSNDIPQKKYIDGEGQYVGSDQVYHHASGTKCWTDYFLVSQNITYGAWYPASDKIYCNRTTSCQLMKMSGRQNCETWTLGMSTGIITSIINLGIDAGYQTQKCSSAADTSMCSWNDTDCHVIWAQQQYLSQKGYSRRRCCDKGGRDYTAWMKNFERNAPTEQHKYACGNQCSDSP